MLLGPMRVGAFPKLQQGFMVGPKRQASLRLHQVGCMDDHYQIIPTVSEARHNDSPITQI